MAILITLLAIFVLVSVIVSGIVYSRQQAMAYRQAQTKHQKQKYQEFDGLFQFIMNVDDSPDIAIVLNNQLLDIAQQLIKLNKKSEEFLLLLDQLKTRATALKDGSLAPKSNKVVSSDSLMRTNAASLLEVGQRLNRLKIRGKLSVPAYEEYLLHLKKLTFDIEYESHIHFAEKLVESNDSRNAISHYKHAREALKKTKVEFPEKNEQIRLISEKIQVLQRGDAPAENSEEKDVSDTTETEKDSRLVDKRKVSTDSAPFKPL